MNGWHRIVTDWWRPGGQWYCWVCEELTEWAYLDMDWQHPDCDMYPSEDGDIKIIKGERVTE